MDEDELLRETDFIVSQAEWKQSTRQPLDTKLCCHIQAFTMEKLQSYIAHQKHPTSIDMVVNQVLREMLYSQGE